MPGNNSGRSRAGSSAVPSTVGRLGVDGFWVRDYGGGGAGQAALLANAGGVLEGARLGVL